MRKNLKFLAFACGALLTLASCSAVKSVPNEYDPTDLEIDTEWVDYSMPATSIKFAEEDFEIALNKGDVKTLHPTISPVKADNGSVNWVSDDVTVATVDRGVITAIGGGHTTITVSSPEELFDDVTLNVNVTVPLESFDISALSLDLDLNEEVRLNASFSPEDASDKSLTWSISDETIATVSEDGLVTALDKEGQAVITVSNAELGEEGNKFVAVTVRDKTVHVESIAIKHDEQPVDSVEVEVGKVLQLVAEVSPSDAKYKDVEWSSDNAEVAAVSEQGLVKANEVGVAHITAKGENNKSKSVTVTVFENVPNSFEVIGDTLKLDSANVKNGQVSVIYKDLSGDEMTPSRPSLEFISSDENVVTVDFEGKVTAVAKGTAVITVNDKQYNLTDTIDVEVVKGTVGVSMSPSATTIAPGESVDIIASVIPSDSDMRDVTFEIVSGAPLIDYTIENNILHIKAGDATGPVVISASVGNISATANVKISDDPGLFESTSSYIVGCNKDETAGFGGSARPSWGDSRYAYKFTEKTVNQYASFEYYGKIYFEEGDEWKIREGDNWRQIVGMKTNDEGSYQIGKYKITEGAFANGEMSAVRNEQDTEYTNVKVNKTGYYDVYYAYYKNDTTPAEGWYEVFAERHSLKVDTTTAKLSIGGNGTIKASLFDGTLVAISSDDSIVKVGNIASDGTISLKAGDTAGTATITIKDNTDTIKVTVNVIDPTSLTSYYLIGSFNNWKTEDVTYNLSKVDDNHYRIQGVSLSSTDAVKVHSPVGEGTWYSNADTWLGCGWHFDGDGNVCPDETGTYTIDFYVEGDNGNHITIGKTGGSDVVTSGGIYLTGTFNDWATENKDYELTRIDANHYQIADIDLLANAKFKVYNASNDGRYTNSSTWGGCNFELEDDGYGSKNVVIIDADTYTIDFYLEADNGNHITVTRYVPPVEPGESFSIKFGTAEPLPLSEVAPNEVDAEKGMLKKYSANADVVAGTSFAFFTDSTIIDNNIGPNADDLTPEAEKYNNYMGTKPSEYTVQADKADATIELGVYEHGFSFWISGGNSPTHKVIIEKPTTRIYIEDQTGKGWTDSNVDPVAHIWGIVFTDDSPYASVAEMKAAGVAVGQTTSYGDNMIDAKMTWCSGYHRQYDIIMPWYIKSFTVCFYASKDWSDRYLKDRNYGDAYQINATYDNEYLVYVSGAGDFDPWWDGSSFRASISCVTNPGYKIIVD